MWIAFWHLGETFSEKLRFEFTINASGLSALQLINQSAGQWTAADNNVDVDNDGNGEGGMV